MIHLNLSAQMAGGHKHYMYVHEWTIQTDSRYSPDVLLVRARMKRQYKSLPKRTQYETFK